MLKAKNVYLAKNKKKALLILYITKTTSLANRPQKIKIESTESLAYLHFCPVKTLTTYFNLRGPYENEDEQFFVFRDKSPVKPEHAFSMLRKMLEKLDLETHWYSIHSFRIGRTSDLIKMGYDIEVVKRMGRWTSNAVYKYIRS